jgi:hypothetical protein
MPTLDSHALMEDHGITTGSGSSRSSAALLALVVGLPLLAILAAFPIVSTAFFRKYCDKTNMQRLTSPFMTGHRRCDVVIYGDSTAQVGLDPVAITQETHLITCNVSVTFPTVSVLGMDPLERFLATGPHPRYLVLSFAPGNFVPPQLSQGGLAWDGLILGSRLGEWRPVLRAMFQDPDRILAVINYVYLGGSLALAESVLHHHGLRPLSEGEGTHFTIPTGPLTSCVATRASRFLPDKAYIDSLRTRFAARADHLILNVSPTSPCIDLFPQWSTALAHTTDDGLAAYSLNLFADDYYHLTGEGAARYSEMVAKQILNAADGDVATSSKVP